MQARQENIAVLRASGRHDTGENERAALEALISYVAGIGDAGHTALNQAETLRKSLAEVLYPEIG